jgi:hypothetical protein
VRKLPQILGFGVIFILAGIQFVRPERNNPAAADSLSYGKCLRLTSDVAHLMETACLDCHSFRTRWPWYSSLAPASWLIASDVRDGRKHLNLSLWGEYSAEHRNAALDDIVNELSHEKMPPARYTLFHPRARLGSAGRTMLVQWAELQKDSVPH